MLVCAACGDAPPPADASGSPDATAAADAAQGSGSGEAVVANLRRSAEIVHRKLMALAEAMPEEDYGWRPMEGVRSVAEVYLHVAADNWFGPALMGIEAPPETGVTTADATVSAYQERALPKAQILEELDASFRHMLGAMEATGDRAGEEIMLRGNPLTVADLWVRLVVHMHEHLGQSIAYARTRDVVPPWSR
jgi:uncharacterized damage-inducible protein DinB